MSTQREAFALPFSVQRDEFGNPYLIDARGKSITTSRLSERDAKWLCDKLNTTGYDPINGG